VKLIIVAGKVRDDRIFTAMTDIMSSQWVTFQSLLHRPREGSVLNVGVNRRGDRVGSDDV